MEKKKRAKMLVLKRFLSPICRRLPFIESVRKRAKMKRDMENRVAKYGLDDDEMRKVRQVLKRYGEGEERLKERILCSIEMVYYSRKSKDVVMEFVELVSEDTVFESVNSWPDLEDKVLYWAENTIIWNKKLIIDTSRFSKFIERNLEKLLVLDNEEFKKEMNTYLLMDKKEEDLPAPPKSDS